MLREILVRIPMSSAAYPVHGDVVEDIAEVLSQLAAGKISNDEFQRVMATTRAGTILDLLRAGF